MVFPAIFNQLVSQKLVHPNAKFTFSLPLSDFSSMIIPLVCLSYGSKNLQQQGKLKQSRGLQGSLRLTFHNAFWYRQQLKYFADFPRDRHRLTSRPFSSYIHRSLPIETLFRRINASQLKNDTINIINQLSVCAPALYRIRCKIIVF